MPISDVLVACRYSDGWILHPGSVSVKGEETERFEQDLFLVNPKKRKKTLCPDLYLSSKRKKIDRKNKSGYNRFVNKDVYC